MRKIKSRISSGYKIIAVDDERGILDSLSVLVRRLGYNYTGVDNPVEAIRAIKEGDFDLLILDFLMEPLQGDEVVKQIRKFNRDLYILLLTGYKDIAPPLKTIKTLDIQGYCEKADNFDQLILFIESAVKTIEQRKTIKYFKDGLKQILDSTPRIYRLQSIAEILGDILLEATDLVKCKNAFILVDNFIFCNSKEESVYKGVGYFDVSPDEFAKMLTPGFMENIGLARDAKKCKKTEEGVVIPIKGDMDKILGVIYLETDGLSNVASLLEVFATQVATSINNIRLHSLVSIKNNELDRTYRELKQRYLDAIQVLRLTVDAKDVYTRGHSDRVAYYAVEIGKGFNLGESDLEKLKAAGIFHDIGKIGIADDILFKTDKLVDNEYSKIKEHPLKGAHILSAMSMFKDVVPIVKYHHERVDGRGYPCGLKGEEIPFLARIISVADAFDAMTSDRQYRTKLKLADAKEQLAANSGTQFDSDVVEKFLDILKNFDEMQKEIEYTYFVYK